MDFDERGAGDVRVSHGEDDVFITKLTSDGEYLWTHTFGGIWPDSARAVAIDASGVIWVAGYFSGEVDFDEFGGGDIRTSQGAWDTFITRLAPDGTYLGTTTFGGPDGVVAGAGIALDADRVVVVGNFGGTVDFDPADGLDVHTSYGDREAFVFHMTTQGQYLKTDTMGGTLFDRANDVAISNDGDIAVVGDYDSADMDFDPGFGEDLYSSNGQADFFVTQFYCGDCTEVNRHDLRIRDTTLISTVYTSMRQGRVKVRCEGPDGSLTQTRRTDGDGVVKFAFENLVPGEYTCEILRVQDRRGNVACEGPFSERHAIVE
ncbi:MAG: hypothetical protein EDS66_13095 [Planctomycetota bacterium]|nr:MAG: hypothetical protein EDS66_13095 [Planctomycetota bacterium]MCQ3922585.1 hypothetical protein [Planctomycetota bacterium]